MHRRAPGVRVAPHAGGVVTTQRTQHTQPGSLAPHGASATRPLGLRAGVEKPPGGSSWHAAPHLQPA